MAVILYALPVGVVILFQGFETIDRRVSELNAEIDTSGSDLVAIPCLFILSSGLSFSPERRAVSTKPASYDERIR